MYLHPLTQHRTIRAAAVKSSVRLVAHLNKIWRVVHSGRRFAFERINVAVAAAIALECIGSSWVFLDGIAHSWNVVMEITALVFFGERVTFATTLLKSILK